jgi:protein-S-isoprenylcysteine O-methyltransferase Ste14
LKEIMMYVKNHDTPEMLAPPPLIYLAALLVGIFVNFIIPTPTLDLWLRWTIGLPLLFLGGGLVTSAMAAMKKVGTTPDPRHPTRALAIEGPYRFTRNPIYMAFTLLVGGIAISFNFLWTLLFLVVALVAIDRGVIAHEERYLEGKFGDQYLAYKARVHRWF